MDKINLLLLKKEQLNIKVSDYFNSNRKEVSILDKQYIHNNIDLSNKVIIKCRKCVFIGKVIPTERYDSYCFEVLCNCSGYFISPTSISKKTNYQYFFNLSDDKNVISISEKDYKFYEDYIEYNLLYNVSLTKKEIFETYNRLQNKAIIFEPTYNKPELSKYFSIEKNRALSEYGNLTLQELLEIRKSLYNKHFSEFEKIYKTNSEHIHKIFISLQSLSFVKSVSEQNCEIRGKQFTFTDNDKIYLENNASLNVNIYNIVPLNNDKLFNDCEKIFSDIDSFYYKLNNLK